MEAKTCWSATSPFEAAFLSRRAGAIGWRGFAYSQSRFARFEEWLSGSAAARYAVLELLNRRAWPDIGHYGAVEHDQGLPATVQFTLATSAGSGCSMKLR